MGKAKRGRPPGGEYPEKTAVMNFRIRPDTKRLLQAAAEASGRTLSQETEHQLRRALVDMGTGPTFALMRVIGTAIDALLRQKRAKQTWTDDPYLFDRVTSAINGAMELFRPPGASQSEEDRLLSKFEGQAAVLELLRLIQTLDTSGPIDAHSPQRRALRGMKYDLGSLVERPKLRSPHDLTADALQEYRESQAERDLLNKAGKTPEEITPEEALRLWRMAGEINQRVKSANAREGTAK
jgi:hypothetical protein